jgi:polysaccharide deacetylase 2 family uncharacterized protein YibQ
MPKRRSRRDRPSLLWIVPVLAAAVIAGWLLLRPLPHARPRGPVAAIAPSAAPTVAQTLAPSPPSTPSPTPALASPTPSPAAGALPPLPENAPRLALIVDDCGQWLTTERGFIALPIPITLAVLPDVHGTATIAREAADAGKGVMLHLPMETISGLYPGPGEITTEMSDAQIAAQVDADIAQVPEASGVNNHEGSKATADPRVMRDVIAALKAHDLFFIDSRTTAKTVAQSTAEADGVPTAARNVFLDDKESVAYTRGQLFEAIAIAKREGSAIAIGHPRPSTLEAVRSMIPEFRSQGVRLVLAQSLVKANESP